MLNRLIPLTFLLQFGCADPEKSPGEDAATDTTTEISEAEDRDGDGFDVEAGDCNDEDDSIYPGAEDGFGDEIDQN